MSLLQTEQELSPTEKADRLHATLTAQMMQLAAMRLALPEADAGGIYSIQINTDRDTWLTLDWPVYIKWRTVGTSHNGTQQWGAMKQRTERVDFADGRNAGHVDASVWITKHGPVGEKVEL